MICILYGCSVPVVLRRLRKRKATSAAESDSVRTYPSSRTESSLSSTYTESSLGANMGAPHISLSRASSNTAFSDSDSQSQSQPQPVAAAVPTLNAPANKPDASYASTGVRKALRLPGEHSDAPTLAVSLESQHRYTLIGPCYVHGMMAGEGFKHQKDHGNKLRAFHLV